MTDWRGEKRRWLTAALIQRPKGDRAAVWLRSLHLLSMAVISMSVLSVSSQHAPLALVGGLHSLLSLLSPLSDMSSWVISILDSPSAISGSCVSLLLAAAVVVCVCGVSQSRRVDTLSTAV